MPRPWLGRALVLLACLAYSCGRCGVAAVSVDVDGVVELHDNDFLDAINQEKLALVEFYAPWCACGLLAPSFVVGIRLDSCYLQVCVKINVAIYIFFCACMFNPPLVYQV